MGDDTLMMKSRAQLKSLKWIHKWSKSRAVFSNLSLALNGQRLDFGTLWLTNSLLWKMAIEIVDFPIENGDFL